MGAQVSALATATARTELTAWMRRQACDGDEVVHLAAIDGGTQNPMEKFEFGGGVYVLRRPAVGADGDGVLGREARVLAALEGSPVPHPRLVGVETSAGILDTPFMVCEFVRGANLTVDEPAPAFRSVAASPGALTDAVAGALAALSHIDVDRIDLADLSHRVDHWQAAQVDRWQRRLDRYGEVDGFDGVRLTGIDELRQRLRACVPAFRGWNLVHGDFHLGNLLVCDAPISVAAIVDWELAALGDSRLDVGHLLVMWPGDISSLSPPAAWSGPSPNDLLEALAARAPALVDDVEWYRDLAAYRMSVLLEGTMARARVGLAEPATGDHLHTMAQEVVERALEH